MYEVIDRQTGARVGGVYATAQRARSRRDKLDLAYGAVRYMVRMVQAQG